MTQAQTHPDPRQLLEAFEAFTAASEHLQARYEALQSQLGQLQGELQTVIEAVPFAIWVLGEDGSLRFTNRPQGLEGRFLQGPAPWEPGSPGGQRRVQTAEGRELIFEEERRSAPHGGTIVTLRDVTEAVLRAQQATREDRLAAMGRMAAELAHEIRNPLGSLALFSGMLVQDLAEQPGPLELARKMQEGVGRLNSLVGNSLSFSRDLHPKLGAIALRAFWEDVLRSTTLAEAVPWENQVPEQATWLGDPDLLRQVAQNLLQNAIRALQDAETPRITLAAVEERLEGQPCWHLTLADNGCGIREEALAKVFDPFFSTFGGGTGLGLAVCHRIIVAHGGLLFIESQMGRGTKVHLRLAAPAGACRQSGTMRPSSPRGVPMSFIHLHPGNQAPEIVNAIIEIPTGSRIKYEIDHHTGLVHVDRVLFSPFHYPAEYGFIPGTLAEDGDPADILVLINGSTYPGVVIRARPIGLLRMTDDKGHDAKILAVATDDPTYAHVTSRSDLPPHFLLEVEHFFLTYKDLERKSVASDGWGGKDEAHAFVRASIENYNKQQKKKK
ncbi:MAG: inorganic diphosphatase [Holophagaceae bacterium]|nr:inorganic diphosphatase [Holophagaceae bacterium]